MKFYWTMKLIMSVKKDFLALSIILRRPEDRIFP